MEKFDTGSGEPLGILWQAPTIVRILIAGEGLALMLTLALGLEQPLRQFVFISVVTQWIVLMTLAELYLLRAHLSRWRAQTVARIALLALLANAWAIAAVVWTIFQTNWGIDPDTWHRLLIRLLGIVLIAGLFGLAAFSMHSRATRLTLRAQRAELEALQARIRPHFLFNTLNTGAALVHSRPEEAERLLLDLADLFRAALAGPRDISLEDELSLVRRYLEIELLRFGDRLRVDWDVPSPIPTAKVPALSIQPLVENAIRHGVERVPHGGRVEITLTTTAEHVVVRIRNPLVFSDAIPPASHGVGLNASQARIEALTGGRGSVQTGRQGEHWVATVRLPRRPESGDRRRR